MRGVLRLDELYYGVLLFLCLLCVFYSSYYVLLFVHHGSVILFINTHQPRAPSSYLAPQSYMLTQKKKETRAYVTESKERVPPDPRSRTERHKRHSQPRNRRGSPRRPLPTGEQGEQGASRHLRGSFSGQPREPARPRTRTHPFLSADSSPRTCHHHPIPYLCVPLV